MTRSLIVATILFLGLLILVIMTTVNDQYIDLNSAKVLKETSITGIRISSSITETEFSKLLRERVHLPELVPSWVITHKIHPFLRPYSPHYYLHGTPTSLKHAATKINEIKDPEAKKILIRKIWATLQTEETEKVEELSY